MRTLPPNEVQPLFKEGALTLLDVRTDDELATARIAGSLDIPLHELPQRFGEIPQDKPLAVICHHGVRSQTAARFLEKTGFGDVISVGGGIDAWSLDVDDAIPRY